MFSIFPSCVQNFGEVVITNKILFIIRRATSEFMCIFSNSREMLSFANISRRPFIFLIAPCLFPAVHFVWPQPGNFSFSSYQNQRWCVDSILAVICWEWGFTPVMICSRVHLQHSETTFFKWSRVRLFGSQQRSQTVPHLCGKSSRVLFKLTKQGWGVV